jgi:hypothetical protein
MKGNLWIALLVAWSCLVGATVYVWVFAPNPGLKTWIARIILSVVCADLSWVCYKFRPRPSVLLDPLKEAVGGYYERDGMCIAPRFKLKDGVCSVHLFVQNRYSRGGSVRIAMMLQGRNGEDMDIAEEIPCDGGALVVRRIPYSIPRNLAGRRVCYRLRLRRIIRIGGASSCILTPDTIAPRARRQIRCLMDVPSHY